ncbi:BglII/BstYI family type II restriction endonuclease [Parapedobacter tibetensis]|uniref:BglII/BstYI family type II restriction endonuclease n=1 Tax=Parapedobacter tibetensis TaxID=2972951 RepID=UPI00214D8A68|nr:BglII/BstYI family type II restriction endonuclease [Parapedobacter tibetensis]
MKVCDQYSHQKGLETIQAKGNLLHELINILTYKGLYFGKNFSKEIKSKVSERFNQNGWADNVKVGNSNLTINFMKSKVGVCFQIGNVARTYADILKLSLLNKNGIIDVGIIIVPHKLESKMMGANYAQFDRLAKELYQFTDIVPVPILIFGLSN